MEKNVRLKCKTIQNVKINLCISNFLDFTNPCVRYLLLSIFARLVHDKFQPLEYNQQNNSSCDSVKYNGMNHIRPYRIIILTQ